MTDCDRGLQRWKKRLSGLEAEKDDAAGDVRRGYQEPDRKIHTDRRHDEEQGD